MRKVILLVLVFSYSLMAQSAYYRLGYGDIYPTTDPSGSSLGQGVVALQDSVRISLQNPAVLGDLKRVYFGAALGSEFRSVDDVVTNNTRLEQLFMSIPIGKKFGMNFATRAISDFKSEYEINTTEGIFSENSEGGLWDYQIGLGYSYSPQIKLGLKLHTFQGLLRRESIAPIGGEMEMYVIKGDISGKSLELGALANLGEKVSLGLTVDVPYSKPVLNGNDSLGGTYEFNEFIEELNAWPTTIKFGVVYHHSDYTKFISGLRQEVYNDAGFDDARVFALPDGWKTVPVAAFQIAMQRIPSDRTSRSWYKRVGWETGVSIKNHYLVLDDANMIFEYSLLTGLNFGLRNGRALFDLSGEFGSRGGDENLPEELFARVKFGIQINDMWFRKVKRR